MYTLFTATMNNDHLLWRHKTHGHTSEAWLILLSVRPPPPFPTNQSFAIYQFDFLNQVIVQSAVFIYENNKLLRRQALCSLVSSYNGKETFVENVDTRKVILVFDKCSSSNL